MPAIKIKDYNKKSNNIAAQQRVKAKNLASIAKKKINDSNLDPELKEILLILASGLEPVKDAEKIDNKINKRLKEEDNA